MHEAMLTTQMEDKTVIKEWREENPDRMKPANTKKMLTIKKCLLVNTFWRCSLTCLRQNDFFPYAIVS